MLDLQGFVQAQQDVRCLTLQDGMHLHMWSDEMSREFLQTQPKDA